MTRSFENNWWCAFGRLAFFWVGILTALVIWRAPAVASEEATAETSRRLALLWCDPHLLFDSGWKRVGRELELTFQALHVEVSWTKGALEKHGRPVSERQIQVVLVQSESAEWGLSPHAMGAVLSRNGPQTEVYVFFNSVTRALGYSPEVLRARWLTAREKRDLARAMSRVIAHEVVHAVLPSRPHDPEGLTRSRLDRSTLLDASVHINRSTAEELRSALTRPAAVVAGAPLEPSEKEPERVSN